MTVPTCTWCGETFRAKGTKRKFCSQRCFHESQIRPGDARRRGRARAARQYPVRPCESCGSTYQPEYHGSASVVHRHHRDGDQMNNDPTNIAFLCRPCHTEAHRVMRAAGIGRRFGGARPRITKLMRDRALARFDEAERLRGLGMSDAAIATRMAVHPWSVKRWFQKYGARES